MSVLSKDGDVAVQWSTSERVAALKRIVPQAAIRIVWQKTGRGRVPCPRLPRWFVVWFVIAMALFCRDSDRQVFGWLHRFREGITPGRSTLCEARHSVHSRHSVGVAPLRLLAEQVIELLLWDRNFLSFALVQQVIQRRAQLLARVKSNLIFEPLRRLRDGSFLAKRYPSPRHRERDEGGLVVRIIEDTFEDSGRSGSGARHRLLTTLLDERKHPAKDLIVLYHERWEQELADDELQTHQRERPVLHSQTPAGVVQELYGLLLGHYVIRKLMCDAAELADVAPRELSFVNTLKILRCRLAEAPRSVAGRQRGGTAALAPRPAHGSRRRSARTTPQPSQPASHQTPTEQRAEKTGQTPQFPAANQDISQVNRHAGLNGIDASLDDSVRRERS